MEKRIAQLLEMKPGLKAKKIALIFGMGRRDVNRFLHRNPNRFEKDEDNRWGLVANGMATVCTLEFGDGWINSYAFEESLGQAGEASISSCDSVHVKIGQGCNIMNDVALKILSLSNQLVCRGKFVCLEFYNRSGAWSYFDRIGFFEHLHEDVVVFPVRLAVSRAETYRGTSEQLLEIASLDLRCDMNKGVPGDLTDKLVRNIHGDPERVEEFEHTVFTIFSELISNVYLHSETSISGFACLQLYQGKTALIAVSDSGLGLLETLRPALSIANPKLVGCTDTEIICEVFQKGLSRRTDQDGKGAGLMRSGQAAIRYKANLDIRLKNSRVRLVPSRDRYTRSKAVCSTDLPVLAGTHICFEFNLDLDSSIKG